ETSAFEAWKKEARELAERQEQITNASRDDLRKALIDSTRCFGMLREACTRPTEILRKSESRRHGRASPTQ
ncbi:hypothetical protein XI09_09450, partial [Bradyrhizobium sp. CCBAU 11386]|nr:hypothetical protein [Bradyrhizobium sp. CCBAU 11386]